MNEIATPSRCIFIRQMTAAPVGVKLPTRVRKGPKDTHTWNVDQWINELIRVPENSHHVAAPLVPVSVFGLGIDELPSFCENLLKKAAAQTESYRRRGKSHVRVQKKTQPILLCLVASYPAPDMVETAERNKWLALTTSTMQAWHGVKLKSGIAHCDEAFFHVHYLIDDDGSPVRHLHAGHAAADAELVKSKKGEAYRAGCQRLLDEFWEQVGQPMGWQRMSPSPRPQGRVSRSQAQRNRQLQQENEATALRKRNAELEERAITLAAAQAQHRENVIHFDADLADGDEYLTRRLEEIDAAEELLKRDREQVRVLKDEYERKKLRIESEAEVIWRVIGEAAERTKAWEGEVRDQVALEARLARVRGMVRPGGGRGGSVGESDDDLSDVPL
jgi:hypothetical protein